MALRKVTQKSEAPSTELETYSFNISMDYGVKALTRDDAQQYSNKVYEAVSTFLNTIHPDELERISNAVKKDPAIIKNALRFL